MGRNRKVARRLKYGPGAAGPRATGPEDNGDDDGDDDGGTGVREPRRPLPPSPLSDRGARPLPEPPVAVRLSPDRGTSDR